jgi:modulator of FtsH protease
MNLQSTFAAQPALSESIRKTLTNTFITVGAMWLITSVSAALAKGMHMGFGMMLGLFVVSLVIMFGVSRYRDSGIGLTLLGVFAAIQGVLLGPVLARYLGMSGGTELVMTAAGLTAAATFGCAMYCVVSRRSFSHWGGFLFAALLVLLVASIIAIFVQSTMLTLALSIAGALLFTVYLLYDISNVVTGRETNYIMAALGVFLDMLNLFTSLLRILGILGSDD